MTKSISRKDLNLKWLELFQVCAQGNSLQEAANETGLSVSTVSHHLRNLENALGVALFDHARRPMVLTPKGQLFLRNIEGPLQAIRKARAEASASDIADASYLRIGLIEDFDSDIAPELGVGLARKMPNCDFSYSTDVSHRLLQMLRDRQLDLGIMTEPSDKPRNLVDTPLLRDPFVLVLPASCDQPAAAFLQGEPPLPFLRFSATLMISRQIDAQLRRIGVSFPHRFECDSNQTLMAMVASGAGWAITTPLLYARARRFQPNLALHPFPGKSFARRITLISTPDCAQSVQDMVHREMRRLIGRFAIDPMVSAKPWLEGSFKLLD